MRFLLLLSSLLFTIISFSQTPALQAVLDSLRQADNFPGLSTAIVYKDNTTVAITSGYI